MDLNKLFLDFTDKPKLAQLATERVDGSLWVCNVYFVREESGTFIWHSAKAREHSQQ